MKFWRHLIIIIWFTLLKGITPHSVTPLTHFRNMCNLKRSVNFSSYKYLLVQRENTKFLGDLLLVYGHFYLPFYTLRILNYHVEGKYISIVEY